MVILFQEHTIQPFWTDKNINRTGLVIVSVNTGTIQTQLTFILKTDKSKNGVNENIRYLITIEVDFLAKLIPIIVIWLWHKYQINTSQILNVSRVLDIKKKVTPMEFFVFSLSRLTQSVRNSPKFQYSFGGNNLQKQIFWEITF